MTTTISDIQKLGYITGIAHGSVQTEQDALTAAQANAAPGAVIETAGQIVQATISDLANAGKLPADVEGRQTLASNIAAAALAMVTEHRTDKVAFHERALAIAEAMPDVWRIEQWAVPPDNDGVPGPPLVLSTLVACKQDGTGWDDAAQEELDLLADANTFAERAWQGLNPDAMAAADTLRAAGHVVERPTPGADAFTVDGNTETAAQLIAMARTAAAA